MIVLIVESYWENYMRIHVKYFTDTSHIVILFSIIITVSSSSSIVLVVVILY